MKRPARLALGVDLGGSKVLAGVVNSRGQMLSRDYSATLAHHGPAAVVRVLTEAMRRAIAGAGIETSQIEAIGIAAAGISDPRTGILHSSPHLPKWKDVPLRDIIERELGVRTVLGNDANAAALGEFRFGAGRGARNLIFITLSTGIGGGIIIDGKLYVGASGAAGEVGHMTIDANGPRCECGNTGCWEALASGTALAKEARKSIREGATTAILEQAGGDIEQVTAQTVHAAALAGDAVARALIGRTAYYVGVGFANLINLFNPELVIVGGGLSNMGDMLLGPAIKVAGERAFPTAFKAARFVPARLGDTSGMVGAAALALGGGSFPLDGGRSG